jgi:hypothetical protein
MAYFRGARPARVLVDGARALERFVLVAITALISSAVVLVSPLKSINFGRYLRAREGECELGASRDRETVSGTSGTILDDPGQYLRAREGRCQERVSATGWAW